MSAMRCSGATPRACSSFRSRVRSRPPDRARHKETDVLRGKINDGMKDALKSQDKLRLSTLRLVNAAIKNADIEARTGGKGPLGDDDLLGVRSVELVATNIEEAGRFYESVWHLAPVAARA